jgi:hypothetical protein
MLQIVQKDLNNLKFILIVCIKKVELYKGEVTIKIIT